PKPGCTARCLHGSEPQPSARGEGEAPFRKRVSGIVERSGGLRLDAGGDVDRRAGDAEVHDRARISRDSTGDGPGIGQRIPTGSHTLVPGEGERGRKHIIEAVSGTTGDGPAIIEKETRGREGRAVDAFNQSKLLQYAPVGPLD